MHVSSRVMITGYNGQIFKSVNKYGYIRHFNEITGMT